MGQTSKTFEFIDPNKFSTSKLNAIRVLKQYTNWCSDHGFTQFISGKSNLSPNQQAKKDSFTINYIECSDSGKFVNFGGVMVNTETLYVALGYNANSDCYIPTLDLVEIFNLGFLGTEKRVLEKENVLYLIESFKLDFLNFDAKSYVKMVLDGNTGGGLSFSSIVLNYVEGSFDKIAPSGDYPLFDKLNTNSLWEAVFHLLSLFIQSQDNFGKVFFKNFIAEENSAEVLKGFQGAKTDKDYEQSYLTNLRDRGVDPVFNREVSSIGFGLNTRTSFLENPNPTVGILATLSGGADIDAFKASDLTNEKVYLYNILDLVRGIGKDQELQYSVDLLDEVGNDTAYTGLLKKLQIDTEVEKLGGLKKSKTLSTYKTKLQDLIDRGSMYNRKVVADYDTFTSFSTKQILNSGKLVERLLQRIIKQFV